MPGSLQFLIGLDLPELIIGLLCLQCLLQLLSNFSLEAKSDQAAAQQLLWKFVHPQLAHIHGLGPLKQHRDQTGLPELCAS